jgi:membrane peptidoglycan carboxypeptidase
MKLVGAVLGLVARIFFGSDWRLFSETILSEHRAHLQSRAPISPLAVECLVAAEDSRFHYHYGVDLTALMRVLWRFAISGIREGASTIEQQLVRTVTGNRERTLARKAKEIMLASALRTILQKREIADLYLKLAYFGWRMNGYDAACTRLAIDKSEMTKRQAANLIARLKYPEPKASSAARTALILRRSEHIVRLLMIDEPLARQAPNRTQELVDVD